MDSRRCNHRIVQSCTKYVCVHAIDIVQQSKRDDDAMHGSRFLAFIFHSNLNRGFPWQPARMLIIASGCILVSLRSTERDDVNSIPFDICIDFSSLLTAQGQRGWRVQSSVCLGFPV